MAGGNPLYDAFNVLKYVLQALKPVPKFKALFHYLQVYRNETKAEVGLKSDEAIAWAENPVYEETEKSKSKKHEEEKEKETVIGIQHKKPEEHKMSVLSRVIDFLISPSFLMCLSIIACAALAFSPLGPVYVAIAATLAAVGIAYEVGMSVYNYRQIKNRQEERAILEGIKGLEKEKNLLLDELSKNCPELKNREFIPSVKPDNFNVNMPKAFLKSFFSIGPGAATVILANALSLNPIGLGIGIASSILSYTGSAGNEAIYRRQLNKLNIHNEALCNELLGEHTTKGRNNDRLLGVLNERKKEVEVLKLLKLELGDRKVSLSEFNNLKAKCMEQVNVQEIGFVRGDKPIIQDILGVLFHGFSKHSSGNRMTPVRPEFNDQYENNIGTAAVLNSNDVRALIRKETPNTRSSGIEYSQEHVAEEIARRNQKQLAGRTGASVA